MATLSVSRYDLFAVTMLPAILKSLSGGTRPVTQQQATALIHIGLPYRTVRACVTERRTQRIFYLVFFTYIYAYAAHFRIYSATFQRLPCSGRQASILTFKLKIFPYFTGSTRKRRQIIFTKFLAGSHFVFTTCTVIIHYIGDTVNSRPLYIDTLWISILSMVLIVSPSTTIYVYIYTFPSLYLKVCTFILMFKDFIPLTFSQQQQKSSWSMTGQRAD